MTEENGATTDTQTLMAERCEVCGAPTGRTTDRPLKALGLSFPPGHPGARCSVHEEDYEPTVNTLEMDDDDEENDEPLPPGFGCEGCGHTRFRMWREIVSVVPDEWDTQPYFNDNEWEVARIECANCGAEWHGDWDWE